MINLYPSQAADRITALLAAPALYSNVSALAWHMIETLSAFANSDGRLVVIGVSDAKDLSRAPSPKAAHA